MNYFMQNLNKKEVKSSPQLSCLIRCTSRDETIAPMAHIGGQPLGVDAIKNVLIVIVLIISWLASPLVLAMEDAEQLTRAQSNTPSESYSALWLNNNNSTEKYSATTLVTKVAMSISGPILRATIRQEFSNPSQFWAEGIYSFPLPEGAVVDQLRMIVGDRIIDGQIHEKKAAKKIYQKARTAGKKTSLLNHHRTNVFTTSVANIGPAETITVEFEYQQVLDYKAQRFGLRFPMVNTPKFTPPRTKLEPNFVEPIAAIRKANDVLGNPVSIDIDLKAGFPIIALTSTSHEVKTNMLSAEHYTISVEGTARTSNRDFVLSWGLKPSEKPMVRVLREDVKGESYGLLMVMPPQPELGMMASMPRELVFVLDVSGSMQGESIQQARASVLKALSQLNEEDHFNIVWFNTQAWTLFEHSQAATSENLNLARRRILNQNADGGTDMRPALQTALRGEYRSERLRQVVFITDGAVSNEAELFSEIKHNLGQNRLFTVGIGSAPNAYFMRKAARAGRGTFTYVSKPDDVNQKISYLLRQLASPSLTDLKLDIDAESALVLSEKLLPDLYLGEPVYVAFKANKFPNTVSLEGKLGGVSSRLNVPMHNPEQYEGVAVEWARRKIAALQGKYAEKMSVQVDRKQSAPYRQSVKNTIIDLAIAHHQVSKFTSLVAVDITPEQSNDDIGAYNFLNNRAGGVLKTHRIPANRPKGWVGQANGKVNGIRLAQTATAGKYQLILGVGLLVLALLFGIFINRLKWRFSCSQA